jgi:hypothetical protein
MAKAIAAVEMMEITASKMVRVALSQGNIAFWAQACAEDARDEFYTATNALNFLRQREAESDSDSMSDNDNENDNEGEGFVGAQGVQGARTQCSIRIMSSASVWLGDVRRS